MRIELNPRYLHTETAYNCAPHIMYGEFEIAYALHMHSRPLQSIPIIPSLSCDSVTAQHVNPLWQWRTPRHTRPPKNIPNRTLQPINPEWRTSRNWKHFSIIFSKKFNRFQNQKYIFMYICEYLYIHIYNYTVGQNYRQIRVKGSDRQRTRQVVIILINEIFKLNCIY